MSFQVPAGGVPSAPWTRLTPASRRPANAIRAARSCAASLCRETRRRLRNAAFTLNTGESDTRRGSVLPRAPANCYNAAYRISRTKGGANRETREPVPAAVAALLVGEAFSPVTIVNADEGMWLLNHPPRKYLRDKHGFDLTDSWLERARKRPSASTTAAPAASSRPTA